MNSKRAFRAWLQVALTGWLAAGSTHARASECGAGDDCSTKVVPDWQSRLGLMMETAATVQVAVLTREIGFTPRVNLNLAPPSDASVLARGLVVGLSARAGALWLQPLDGDTWPGLRLGVGLEGFLGVVSTPVYVGGPELEDDGRAYSGLQIPLYVGALIAFTDEESAWDRYATAIGFNYRPTLVFAQVGQPDEPNHIQGAPWLVDLGPTDSWVEWEWLGGEVLFDFVRLHADRSFEPHYRLGFAYTAGQRSMHRFELSFGVTRY